jgi:hypothetical protein
MTPVSMIGKPWLASSRCQTRHEIQSRSHASLPIPAKKIRQMPPRHIQTVVPMSSVQAIVSVVVGEDMPSVWEERSADKKVSMVMILEAVKLSPQPQTQLGILQGSVLQTSANSGAFTRHWSSYSFFCSGSHLVTRHF